MSPLEKEKLRSKSKPESRDKGLHKACNEINRWPCVFLVPSSLACQGLKFSPIFPPVLHFQLPLTNSLWTFLSMLNAIFPPLPLKMRTLVDNLQCLECFFKYTKFYINLNWGSKQILQNTKAKVILTVHCCYLKGDGQHKNLEQAIWETKLILYKGKTLQMK